MTFRDEISDQFSRTGFNFCAPHDFEFYLYFGSERAAGQVKSLLTEHGFQSEVKVGPEEETWLCLARKTLVPSKAALDDIAALFDTLSEAHGGEFDGWEATPAS